MQIPGVDWATAATIIAEIGVDMSAFASAAGLASWAGLCPGNHESAGRQRSGATRHGNIYLKAALVTAAVTGGRKRGSYLADKYRRLKARRGALRAAVAIGHKTLVAAYHMLANGSGYLEVGASYLDRLHQHQTTARLTERLRDMGHEVHPTPKAA